MRDISSHIKKLLTAYDNGGKVGAQALYVKIIERSKLTRAEAAVLAQKFQEKVSLAKLADKKTAIKSVRRATNPVPPSSRHGTLESQRAKAGLLYETFTGHSPGEEIIIDRPGYPDVMSVIGDIDGIMYTTVRDGVTEKYIHKFKMNSRPLFCVAPDGLTLYMIGGSYEFGDRGIVDK